MSLEITPTIAELKENKRMVSEVFRALHGVISLLKSLNADLSFKTRLW